MADSKSRYSAAAKFYARIMSHGSLLDAVRYAKSKLRESLHNETWKEHPVNINDIVNQFTPGVKGKPKGVKFEFENADYIIKADMPAGYLRIFDKHTNSTIMLDGTPSNDPEKTHFKILKRKEMHK